MTHELLHHQYWRSAPYLTPRRGPIRENVYGISHWKPASSQCRCTLNEAWRSQSRPTYRHSCKFGSRREKAIGSWQISALPDPDDQDSEAIMARARVRSEVLAPFRLVRMVFYGFFTVSASISLLFAFVQLLPGLANKPSAIPVLDSLQSIGIDVAAIVVFVLLFRSDYQARQKQIARLTREETLASLQVELSNRKRLRLAELRKFARPILVAGTSEQVKDSIETAESLKEELAERGVLLVPLPLFDSQNNITEASPSLNAQDLKFKANALQQHRWKSWFEDQMKLSNAKPEKGLYVGLRLDGRVRASGVGSPNWQKMIKELPPVTGAWKGILDGMDGKVDAWN